MMEKTCVVCGQDFEAKRVTARYCSDKCRKVAFQTAEDVVSVLLSPEVSVPENGKTLSVPVSVPKEIDNIEQPKLSKLTAEELYNGINSYERDLWVDSPKYSELKKRLKTLSIEELREQGFSIPCWKLNGLSSPFKT